MAKLYLLSRLNPASQAIAIPEWLTEDERNQIFRRPPPQILAQTLKSLTGFSTIDEVLQNYWNPDRMYLLSGEAIAAIAAEWWTAESYETCRDFDLFRKLGQTSIEDEAATIRAYLTVADELEFKQAALRDARHVSYASSMISIGRSIATNTKQRSPPSLSACQSTPDFLEGAIKLIIIIAREIVLATPRDASHLVELRRYAEDKIKGGCINMNVSMDYSDLPGCTEEFKEYVRVHRERIKKDALTMYEERNYAIQAVIERAQFEIEQTLEDTDADEQEEDEKLIELEQKIRELLTQMVNTGRI